MTAANIASFLRGAHHLVSRPDGLVRPARMSDKQVQAAAEGGREQAARNSAGVTINLVTTGDEVSFDLAVLQGIDETKHSVQETIELAGPDAPDANNGLVDGIDLFVDGAYVRTAPVASGLVSLSFENPSHAPAEVCVYLPSLSSVAVGNLSTNGTIEPAPERGYLLALGDSITQGYVVGKPGMSWPARVARACGLDLVNQAIAGHHFDRATLRGMRPLRENPPALIVVAYGTNDWAHAESKREITANMAKYLERVANHFPDTPVYVVSPVWRADEAEPRRCGRSLAWVRSHLCDECARYGLRYVDGAPLVPSETGLFADGRLHPNAEGARLMAEGVLAELGADGILAELGGRHDSPVARADAQTRLRPEAPARQTAFDEVARTIWRLRQPDGCPWDREQTHSSIAKNMIEEAYEAVEAIEAGDVAHLREELGDVLMQVLLHAQIAADAGEFTIADVCHDLDEKLVRRHPHVFGAGVSAKSASEVLDIWSSVKLEEHREAGEGAADGAAGAAGVHPGSGASAAGSDISAAGTSAAAAPAAQLAPKPGLLDAVPRSMPALMQAQKISRKAAACGFDWDSTADVWRKMGEERAEFEAEAPGSEGALEEFGDVLFSAVNVARREGLDAETALRASCDKYRQRWAAMEAAAAGRGAALEDLSHDELEALWAQAKESERA